MASKRQKVSERERLKALEARDWKLRKAVYQVRRCHRQVLGDAPPGLIEAAYMDPGARRVLDDWLLDRGIDVGAGDFDELDYMLPYGVSSGGREAWRVIMAFLKEHGLVYSGGACKVFYSPEEWAQKESVGEIGAMLVVTYDGGAHRPVFAPDHRDDYVLQEQLTAALEREGFYFEQLYSWASGVYPL